MPLHNILTGHECTTPQRRGWGGVKNGELLQRAEGAFDLFITADQNIRYQQNLLRHRVAILELSTKDLRRILAASAEIVQCVEAIRPGEFRQLAVP